MAAVADAHGRHLGDVEAADLAGAYLLVEARAAAVGTGAHRQHRVEHGGVEQPLLRVDDAAVHARDEAFVFGGFGPVGRRVLQFDLRRVEEEVEFLGRVVLDLLVEVEEAAVGVAYPAPAALAEGDVVDGVLVVERLVEIHQLVDVQLADLAQSAAARTAARGVVEREGVGVAHEGLPDAREEQTQQGVDVGVGAHGGAGVGGRLALLDDDGDGQVPDVAHVRPPVLGQVLLREGGEGVVELAPRLGRDGVQHQRRLPRPRHARHHGDFPLGNPDVDVLEVVLRGIADDDVGEIVGLVIVNHEKSNRNHYKGRKNTKIPQAEVLLGIAVFDLRA